MAFTALLHAVDVVLDVCMPLSDSSKLSGCLNELSYTYAFSESLLEWSNQVLSAFPCVQHRCSPLLQL